MSIKVLPSAVKKRPPGGSRKGRPNKITKTLKEMILAALDAAGGQQYLTNQALKNPNAFLTLIGKVLPQDINAKVAQSPLTPEQADRIVNGE